MLPDLEDAERDIDRIFSQYRIPYYADRRRKLSEHPVCDFIINSPRRRRTENLP